MPDRLVLVSTSSVSLAPSGEHPSSIALQVRPTEAPIANASMIDPRLGFSGAISFMVAKVSALRFYIQVPRPYTTVLPEPVRKRQARPGR